VSGVLAVILSAAQELCGRLARPFAEFTLSAANGLRVTGILSKCLVTDVGLRQNSKFCVTIDKDSVPTCSIYSAFRIRC